MRNALASVEVVDPWTGEQPKRELADDPHGTRGFVSVQLFTRGIVVHEEPQKLTVGAQWYCTDTKLTYTYCADGAWRLLDAPPLGGVTPDHYKRLFG